MYIFHLLIMLPIGFVYWLGYALTRIGKSKDRVDTQKGIWLRRFFLRMGPLYIKLGQILSCRSDLFTPETIKELQNLQDNVPADSDAYIRKTIEKNYNRPIESVFKEFSFCPIASASIAQVHQATLKNGDTVAVKIIKKNVRRQLSRNLKALQLLGNMIQLCSPAARQMNMKNRIAEVNKILIDQADLRMEAKSQRLIYENHANHPYVKIPMLYNPLCSSDILVMEFVSGIRGLDFKKVDFTQKRLAQRFMEIFYTMLYHHGVCQGDPHPGNVFFTKDGTFIIVDFGITVYLTEDEKWGLASFFYAAIRHEWDTALKRFNNHFVICDEDLLENTAYVEEMLRVIKHHFHEVSDQWSTADVYRDINAVLRRYGAKYTTVFTKVDLMMASCEGFTAQMDPNIDIWENARRFSNHFSPYMNDEVKNTFDSFFSEYTPGSVALRDRGKHSLVASSHLDRYFFPSAYPIFVKKAFKSTLTDVDGNRYIDFSCGYGPHILGYGHPVITAALEEGIKNTNLNAIGHAQEVELAEMLVEAFPTAEKAIFSNSGTEAVIHAIRICRAYRPKATKVVKFEGHYHGFSDLAMVSSWFRVSGDKRYPEPIANCAGTPSHIVKDTIVYQPMLDGIDRLKEVAEDVACVLIEPMPAWKQIDTGREFLQELRRQCSALGIPLVFDEVVSGFRATYGGVQNLVDVHPDITTLGKIIGGGLPAGAVVGKKELIDVGKTTSDPFTDYEEKAFLGGTMSGNYLSCTAGIAMLKYLKSHPELYDKMNRNTEWLSVQIKRVAQKHGVLLRVKAYHTVCHLLFTHRDAKYSRDMFQGCNYKASLALAYYMRKYGVYQPELHVFLINAVHTDEELLAYVDAFDKSLSEMVAAGFFVF